jgi:hypothetical protein
VNSIVQTISPSSKVNPAGDTGRVSTSCFIA